MKEYVLHFPGGAEVRLDNSYHDACFNVGDKVVLQGEKAIWVVAGVQHQVRGGIYMMTNVILEESE